MKSKRWLLSLASGLAILSFTSIAVACSNTSSNNNAEETTIIDVPQSIQDTERATLKSAIDNNNLIQPNIAILTGGGVFRDQSFNQSSFEVSRLIGKTIQELGGNNVTIRPFDTTDDQSVLRTYTQALENQNIWIATGFQHANLLRTWLGQAENRRRFIEKKILVLGVDWTAIDNPLDQNGNQINFTWPPGQIINLTFKAEESSYVLGYAAAEYLSETFPSDNDAAKRTFVTFGGADFPGITSFNYGYLQGAIDFNKQAKINNKPTVKWPAEQPRIELTTGFQSSSDANAKVTQALTQGNPSIVMPVVGILLNNVYTTLSQNNSDALVIGTDTDNSISYPSSRGRIFSTSTKNVASAVYQVLIPFITNNTNDPFLKGIIGNDATKMADFSFVGTANPQNVNIFRGIKDNFVGTTAPTVSDATAKTRITAAIANGVKSLNDVGFKNLAQNVLKGGDTEFLNGKITELNNDA